MSGLVRGRPGSRAFEPSYEVGDESAVPTQDRVWCHDAGDVRKAPPAKDLPFHGQPASLVIREAQPSGALRRAEDAVLLEQVINDRLLLAVHPAGEQQEEESERGRQTVHLVEACPTSRRGSSGARLWARRSESRPIAARKVDHLRA